MNERADRIPVLLVRTGKRQVTVVAPEDDLPVPRGWLSLTSNLAKGILPMLGLSADRNGVAARVFEMKPEDLKYWDKLQKWGTGDGFAYGTMVDGNGKISRNAAFREASRPNLSPAPVDPIALATAVAVMQIQAQLERLADAIEDVDAKVELVVRHLELEQQSELLAALETIDECHLALERNTIDYPGEIDWSRLSALEQVLKKQHRQVVGELNQVAEQLKFQDIAEARKAARIRPERVEDLLTLEYYLLRGLSQWNQLMLAAKQAKAELTGEAIDAAESRTAGYIDHARQASRAIETADSKPRSRSAFQKLRKDGLIVGGRNDRNVLESATGTRSKIRDIARAREELSPPKLGVIGWQAENESP